MQVTDNPWVTSNPNICGGQPVLIGTRVPFDLVLALFLDETPEEIEELCGHYPTLDFETVCNAIEYHRAHR